MYLPTGTLLNQRYRVENVLGHGGFAVTYLATDQQFNLRVAVKEYLPRQLAGRTQNQLQVSVYTEDDRRQFDNGLQRFLEEARAIARFENHPNIVNVKDYFRQHSTAYMVMSYVEGENFRSFLGRRGGKIPFDLALSIMIPILDALREVHAVGLLHRDVSPDNIYLTTQGQVILLDFGAARYFSGEAGHSLSLILKSGYAPLEQYQSQGNQGVWTDEYAVAATIYRAITGINPPEATDRLHKDPLEPPSRLGVDLPPLAEEALLRALSVKVEDRFPSIQEFQQALSGQSLGDTPPISATSATPGALVSCPHCRSRLAVPPGHPLAGVRCGVCGRFLGGSPERTAKSGLKPLAIFLGIILGIIPLGLLIHYVSQLQTRPTASQVADNTPPKPPPTPKFVKPPDPSPPTPPDPGPGKASPAVEAYTQALSVNDLKTKIPLLEEALRLKPDFPEAQGSLALAYFQQGVIFYQELRYDEALQYFSKAIDTKSDNLQAFDYRGNVYLKKNAYDLALQDFNQALALKPDYGDAYYNRARVYQLQKKTALAQSDYLQALRYKGDFAQAYQRLAELAEDMKQKKQAQAYLKKARELIKK